MKRGKPIDGLDDFGFGRGDHHQEEYTPMVMYMITREQAAQGKDYTKKWQAIGRAVAPVDRDAFNAAVTRVYDAANLPAPRVIWAPSPLKGIVIAATQIAAKNYTVTGKVLTEPMKRASDALIVLGNKVHSVLQKELEEPAHAASDAAKAVAEELLIRASVIADKNQSVGQVLTQLVHRACINEVGELAVFDFAERVLNVADERVVRDLITCVSNCNWWWPHNGVVIATELPARVERDEQQRVHCETGPAIVYSDGFEVYCLNGKRVPFETVTSPKAIAWGTVEATVDKPLQAVVVDAKARAWSKEKPAESTDGDEGERFEAAMAVKRLGGIGLVKNLTEGK